MVINTQYVKIIILFKFTNICYLRKNKAYRKTTCVYTQIIYTKEMCKYPK